MDTPYETWPQAPLRRGDPLCRFRGSLASGGSWVAGSLPRMRFTIQGFQDPERVATGLTTGTSLAI